MKKLSLRAFEVVGDRGNNTRQIVLRGANCKDSVRIASLFCLVFFVNKSFFFLSPFVWNCISIVVGEGLHRSYMVESVHKHIIISWL